MVDNGIFRRMKLVWIVLLAGASFTACQPGTGSAVPTARPTAVDIADTDPPAVPENEVTRVITVTGPDYYNCEQNSIRPVENSDLDEGAERPLMEYIITGTVPSAATTGWVGFDVGLGANCVGTAEIILDSVTYSENGRTSIPVPNGRFDNKIDGWNIRPSGSEFLSLIASPTSDGQALFVQLPIGKELEIRSGSFEVVGGSDFTATFLASLSPGTFGRGTFEMNFLGNFDGYHGVVTVLPFEAQP